MNTLPFNILQKTLQIDVTVNTGDVSTKLHGAGNSIRIVNDGNKTVFVNIGKNDVKCLATDPNSIWKTAILSGQTTIMSIPNDMVYNISAVTKSGTSTIYVQVGEGV